MIEVINGTTFAQLISFIGIGSFIDAVLPPKARDTIARFVFFAKGIDRKTFEVTVISGLIQAISHKENIERFAVKKVLFFSVALNTLSLSVGTAAFLYDGGLNQSFAPPLVWTGYGFQEPHMVASENGEAIVVYWPTWTPHDPEILIYVIAGSLVATFLALPLFVLTDYISLRITRWIWYYRVHQSWKLPLLWVADALASILASVVIFFLAQRGLSIVNSGPGSFWATVLTAFFVGSIFSLVAVNFLHVLILFTGNCLRALSVLLDKYNKRIPERLYNWPVAVCFAVAGSVALVLESLTWV